jgi:tetratricopeptide (TPR) repeat protein
MTLDVCAAWESGTSLAPQCGVKKPHHAAAERMKTHAQALVSAGKLTAALEAYGRAAETLPNDAWLHHAAGELAKKLKQNELAAAYFRKAGAAFMASGFNRYALPALRNSWVLFRTGLPATSRAYREVTCELAAVQRELGFETDATMTEDVASSALEGSDPSELRSQESAPPRESSARELKSRFAPRGFRGLLERVRRALTA